MAKDEIRKLTDEEVEQVVGGSGNKYVKKIIISAGAANEANAFNKGCKCADSVGINPKP